MTTLRKRLAKSFPSKSFVVANLKAEDGHAHEHVNVDDHLNEIHASFEALSGT
jgi:hypothetical protein